MPNRIFVCHSNLDTALIEPYAAALRLRGVDLWYRPSAEQFGPLSSDDKLALHDRRVLLVMLTQHAIESYWVKQEMQVFLDLMVQEPDRRMLLVQIAPCHVQPGLPSGVLTLDATRLPVDVVTDAIMDILGQPTVTTTTYHSTFPPATPPYKHYQSATPRMSRRNLLTAGGGIGAILLVGGGAAWALTRAASAATTPEVNVADPGTPRLLWQPSTGEPIAIPLRLQHPPKAIDLRDQYRIDAPLGGFVFDSTASDLSCVVSGIPLVFGSLSRPGHYFVAAPKCFTAPAPVMSKTNAPLDSLIIAYTFGGDTIAPPCTKTQGGTALCLPTQRPTIPATVSNADAETTATTYYQAISKNRYQDAYSMLALAAQSRQPLADFKAYWQIGPITLVSDFWAVGQNGDGSVALSLTYQQSLADGLNRWRATVVVQRETNGLSIMPLGRIKLGDSLTPTPSGGSATPAPSSNATPTP